MIELPLRHEMEERAGERRSAECFEPWLELISTSSPCPSPPLCGREGKESHRGRCYSGQKEPAELPAIPGRHPGCPAELLAIPGSYPGHPAELLEIDGRGTGCPVRLPPIVGRHRGCPAELPAIFGSSAGCPAKLLWIGGWHAGWS